MIVKSSLTILCLMLITSLKRSSSMSLKLAKPCQVHHDCGAISICDKGWCRMAKSLPELEKRKPIACSTFFKAPCSSDADCFCKTGSMICESNECVLRTSQNLANSNHLKK